MLEHACRCALEASDQDSAAFFDLPRFLGVLSSVDDLLPASFSVLWAPCFDELAVDPASLGRPRGLPDGALTTFAFLR